MTGEFVRMCPECGSAYVGFGALVGAQGKCKACGWQGPREEMLHMPVFHDMGSHDAILKALLNDLRNVFANQALLLSLARILYRWGFLPEDQKKQSAALQLYLTGMARAMCVSIIQTRARMETPRHD